MDNDQANSEITIVIEQDASAASILIPVDFDPNMVSADHLAGIAQGRGVVVDAEAKEKLARVAEGFCADPHDIEAVFAQASDPQDGTDGRVEWAEGFDPDAPPEEVVPDENDHGEHAEAKDFYNAVRYIHVREGDVLAQVFPETRGVDGNNVLGGVIMPNHGVKLNIQFDRKSTSMDDEGVVKSNCAGVLRKQGLEISVSDVMEVRGFVDFSTGNIDAEGSVHVLKGVRDHFEITATRHVTIEGLVEAAIIRCGGSLELRRGMAARVKGVLQVGGDANVGFLNNVRGTIVGSVHVEREILNCELFVGGDLMAPRAALIGGTTVITGSMNVGTLGAEGDSETLVLLGTTPLLIGERRKLIKFLEEVEAALEVHSTEYAMLQESAALSVTQKERLTELNFHCGTLQEQRDTASTRLAEIEDTMRRLRRVDLQVNKYIHPRVVFATALQKQRFTEPLKGPVRISWSESGRLMIKKDHADPREITALTRAA